VTNVVWNNKWTWVAVAVAAVLILFVLCIFGTILYVLCCGCGPNVKKGFRDEVDVKYGKGVKTGFKPGSAAQNRSDIESKYGKRDTHLLY
jgi:tetrahydromethanopterin S-methyltransferase subunit D